MSDRVLTTFLNCRPLLAVLLLTFATIQTTLADDASPTSKEPAPFRAEHGVDRDPNEPVSTERIDELIRQLGHPRYTVRRAAANDLLQIGPEAFDLLHAASGDSDPEVAASARYLLRQITVRWVHADDPPSVRRLLLEYGEKSDELRSVRVLQLARLADGEGLAALCRIARFDRSPLVSRQAALAIIRPGESAVKQAPIDTEAVDQELGASRRVSVMWLRQHLTQLRDPAAAVAAWHPLIDAEAAYLEQHADDTSPEIVLGLLWNVAEVHRQLGDKASVMTAVDRMIALDENLVEQTSVELLEWITRHKSWEILDEFLATHQARIERGKRPLYFAALARAEQGQTDLADELAERAVGLDAQAPLENFWMAKELEQRGKYDWSVRQYQHVLATQPVEAHEAIISRVELSALLFDHAEHKAAADAVEPFVKAMTADEKIAQLYAEIQRHDFRHYDLVLPMGDSVSCRYHFYRANQYHDEKDWQREREELQRAIKLDRTDADVLIAMYRVPEADEAWRKSTLARIRALCQEFQQDIDDAPNNPTPYNQWAWLVANTEGDYQKAIRYSHRSIELIPPAAGESAAASFLDTLGRCYYAAGDIENAVKYQRQAVDKIDYLQVMHRQLALFEKSLAEKQSAGSEKPAAKSTGAGPTL